MVRKIGIGAVVWTFTVGLIIGAVNAQGGEKKLTVGSKNFTEQAIVGQMMKQLLEDRGFKVDLRSDLTSMALRAGMESGDIDICADYTGTAWMVHLKRTYKPGVDNNRLFGLVRKADNINNFIWTDPIWNNNTYALASWPEFAEEHDLTNLSDLAKCYQSREGKIETFVNFEFSTRPDGLPALERLYNFKVAKRSLKTGTPGASLIALKGRKTAVAMVFATDAAIAKHRWHIYSDDKAFFPPYDLTPYVRKDAVDRCPEVVNILKDLTATFPGGGRPATPEAIGACQKVWQELNAEVDIEKMEPTEVAHEYLRGQGLIKE